MAVLCMCQMGEFLCSGSADKSIGIWKREAYGKLSKVGLISGHEGPVKCLQASPASRGGGRLHTWRRGMDIEPDRISDFGVQFEKHKCCSDFKRSEL
uniref:Uncharacterized protein n=1 Tax=Quercus lobata TaxID=97700 RepID=A0A7N2R584_QUELO